MSQLKSAVKALHARKDLAYGGAWKRRGERVSVLPNIARKVDRITAFADEGTTLEGETILDTAIDLYVYAGKYRLFLADLPEADRSFIPPDAPFPFSDRHENFNSLVDGADFSGDSSRTFLTLAHSIASMFEGLWQAADANAPLHDRQRRAGELCAATEQLVGLVVEEYSSSVREFVSNELKL